MKRLLMNLVIGFMAVGLLATACKKKKDDTPPVSPLPEEVNNFVPDSILNEMKTLGMPINEGNTPPNIENTYLARPFILKASNRPGDNVGSQFYDYRVTFYEQNNEKRTIKCDYVNGTEMGTGLGSYVSGNDGAFTVFSEMNITNGDAKAKIVQVISGTLVEDGIKDFYYANFMIDNFGNTIFLDNGQGRVIYDSDGMSEKVVDQRSGFVNEDTTAGQTVSSVNK